MRLFNPSDYDTESAARDVALLLSERSRSLFLAVMSIVDARYRWIEQTDAEWDDTEGMIAQALDEIMDENTEMNLPEPVNAILRKNANQLIAANTPTNIAWNEAVHETHADMWTSDDTTKIIVPLDGVYSLLGNIQLGGVAITTGVKSADVILNGTDIIYRAESQSGVPNLAIALQYPLAVDDELQILVTTPISLNVIGSSNNETIISVNREYST